MVLGGPHHVEVEQVVLVLHIFSSSKTHFICQATVDTKKITMGQVNVEKEDMKDVEVLQMIS